MRFHLLLISMFCILMTGCQKDKSNHMSVLEDKESIIQQWFGEDYFLAKDVNDDSEKLVPKRVIPQSSFEFTSLPPLSPPVKKVALPTKTTAFYTPQELIYKCLFYNLNLNSQLDFSPKKATTK